VSSGDYYRTPRVSIHGTHKLSPQNGTLRVRTARTGAAAKAGHDLLIEVTSWEATLTLGEESAESAVSLDADGTSLQVLEGTGGMMELGESDKESIHQTIHDDVLHGTRIEFRSSEVSTVDGSDRLGVSGELTLLGHSHPVSFDVLVAADGSLTATAVIRQSDWQIKPYSTLFGALKVADEIEVSLVGGPLVDG
jgi:polyisoprenoid-binding protein YceI